MSTTVYPKTTPMTGWDAGQWVTYRVWARDVTSTTPGNWAIYDQQAPVLVTRSVGTTTDCGGEWGIFGCAYTGYDNSVTELGSFTVNGYAGHRYQVSVQFG